jgi:hypothetical protein
MRDEDLICKELADVPPVPPKAFVQIERKIKAATIRKQMVFTVAATLILSLGVSTWFLAKQSTAPVRATLAVAAPADAVVPTDIAYELQIARDFINGDDLDNDTEQYALLDSGDF